MFKKANLLFHGLLALCSHQLLSSDRHVRWADDIIEKKETNALYDKVNKHTGRTLPHIPVEGFSNVTVDPEEVRGLVVSGEEKNTPGAELVIPCDGVPSGFYEVLKLPRFHLESDELGAMFDRDLGDDWAVIHGNSQTIPTASNPSLLSRLFPFLFG